MRVAMLVVAAWLWAPAVLASSDDTGTEDKAPEKVLIEIYRIAPGKHEAFLRDIAAFDKANELAGLPPRQLYVHSDGAGWDFLLIQPARTPADKSEALENAWKELELPSGTRFFLKFRENILEHSDTFAYGPVSAGAVLESLD